MKNRLVVWIIALIVLFPIINFYIPTRNLPDDYKIEVEKLSMENEDDIKFIKSIYNEIGSTFTSDAGCWSDYGGRNYLMDGGKIFKLKGECLPCHIQNNLLQASLIESGRFEPIQLKTIQTVCWSVPMFHIYSEIHLDDGEILKVDTWGRNWNVNFGETIKDTEVCNK